MKKEGKGKLSLTLWCTALLFVENLVAVGISTVAVTIINSYLAENIRLSSEILVFIFSLAIGAIIAIVLNKAFIMPMRKIYKSMSKVAKGDFSIRINEKTRIREIDNIYSNFNIMTEELGAMETLQSDFISNVSHEFKTPLTAIEGYSTLLKECKSEQERKLYIDKIQFSSKRLSILVSDILLLSKLENQNIQPKKAKYRLDEQIRQAILIQEIKWKEKCIELDVELDKVYYYGTEALLSNVWSNLLSNAIKFSPQSGKITMRLVEEDGQVIFTISDQGKGVLESEINHLFDKFYQGDSAHKSEGSGLGLALAKRVVNINNGKIEVRNNQLGSCEFKVTLPK